MVWRAVLKSGKTVSSVDSCVLSSVKDDVSRFTWEEDVGKAMLSLTVPLGCTLVAFKRNYVDTNQRHFVVYVAGWVNKEGHETLAFLQPSGLIEMADSREFVTTFERSHFSGVSNGCDC